MLAAEHAAKLQLSLRVLPTVASAALGIVLWAALSALTIVTTSYTTTAAASIKPSPPEGCDSPQCALPTSPIALGLHLPDCQAWWPPPAFLTATALGIVAVWLLLQHLATHCIRAVSTVMASPIKTPQPDHWPANADDSPRLLQSDPLWLSLDEQDSDAECPAEAAQPLSRKSTNPYAARLDSGGLLHAASGQRAAPAPSLAHVPAHLTPPLPDGFMLPSGTAPADDEAACAEKGHGSFLLPNAATYAAARRAAAPPSPKVQPSHSNDGSLGRDLECVSLVAVDGGLLQVEACEGRTAQAGRRDPARGGSAGSLHADPAACHALAGCALELASGSQLPCTTKGPTLTLGHDEVFDTTGGHLLTLPHKLAAARRSDSALADTCEGPGPAPACSPGAAADLGAGPLVLGQALAVVLDPQGGWRTTLVPACPLQPQAGADGDAGVSAAAAGLAAAAAGPAATTPAGVAAGLPSTVRGTTARQSLGNGSLGAQEAGSSASAAALAAAALPGAPHVPGNLCSTESSVAGSPLSPTGGQATSLALMSSLYGLMPGSPTRPPLASSLAAPPSAPAVPSASGVALARQSSLYGLTAGAAEPVARGSGDYDRAFAGSRASASHQVPGGRQTQSSDWTSSTALPGASSGNTAAGNYMGGTAQQATGYSRQCNSNCSMQPATVTPSTRASFACSRGSTDAAPHPSQQGCAPSARASFASSRSSGTWLPAGPSSSRPSLAQAAALTSHPCSLLSTSLEQVREGDKGAEVAPPAVATPRAPVGGSGPQPAPGGAGAAGPDISLYEYQTALLANLARAGGGGRGDRRKGPRCQTSAASSLDLGSSGSPGRASTSRAPSSRASLGQEPGPGAGSPVDARVLLSGLGRAGSAGMTTAGAAPGMYLGDTLAVAAGGLQLQQSEDEEVRPDGQLGMLEALQRQESLHRAKKEWEMYCRGATGGSSPGQAVPPGMLGVKASGSAGLRAPSQDYSRPIQYTRTRCGDPSSSSSSSDGSADEGTLQHHGHGLPTYSFSVELGRGGNIPLYSEDGHSQGGLLDMQEQADAQPGSGEWQSYVARIPDHHKTAQRQLFSSR